MLQSQAIIFDMDGLMIDSEPMWWRAEKQLAKDHGAPWSDGQALSCVGKGLPNVIVTMQKAFSLPLSVEEGVAYLVDAFIANLADLKLKPGCTDFVAAGTAAPVPMAVASSSTMRLINAVLSRFDMTDRFDAVVSGDSVQHSKPAPDIFLSACEALGLAPSACLVLEDSIAGVQAAVAAGAPVIAVPEQAAEQFVGLTPHIVSDLHEALALVSLEPAG